MSIQRFADRFPEQGSRETLMFEIREDIILPDGKYLIFDGYCTNVDCDCREITLVIFDAEHAGPEIAILWYDLGPRPNASPTLHLDLEQTYHMYDQRMLEILTEHLFQHPEYGEMLKRHFKKFRAALIQEQFSNPGR